MPDAPASAPRALAPFSLIGADRPFATAHDRFAAHVGPSLVGAWLGVDPQPLLELARAGGVEGAGRLIGYGDDMPARYVAIDALATR